MYKNSTERYGAVAQVLHWLIAILILTQFVLASIFAEMPLGMDKIKMIVLHKSIGMSVLLLALVRILWRYLSPPPDLPASLKSYERCLARLTHWGLYILIFAMPVSGWVMSSYAKIPVDYFGLFSFPDIVVADKTAVPTSKNVHKILSNMLIALVIVHLLAVIKHQFILKDAVLRRMLPQFSKRE